ncbi:MAG: hypothetical protein AB7N80_16065 [Bdellovibrionales bacterium]
MKRPQKNKANSSLRSAVQTAVALLFLGLGWMMWDSGSQSTSSSSLKPVAPHNDLAPLTLERINHHMQFTERKNELRALAMEIENFELGKRLKPGDLGTDDFQDHPAHNPFESENVAGRVYRDLNPAGNRYDNPILPEDRVNSMLEQEQWVNKYDKKQTEAFVKSVRDKARAAGYELEINDQLQVVGVRRAPNSVQSGAPAGAK